jgi:transcriptional regulator with GAF, ATPase, and Fis domain
LYAGGVVEFEVFLYRTNRTKETMKSPQTPGVGPTARRARATQPDETDATYVLTLLEGPDTGAAFALDASTPTRALLGTSPVCSVRLTDSEVSRRHAALTITANHVQYIDLGSTNGTTVNGVIVKEASLVGGEAIRVGRSVFSLKRGEPKGGSFGVATGYGRIVGESTAMRRIYPLIERLAATDLSVLIEGEVGTGKELLAEEMHRTSQRANAPFVVLEASAIPLAQIASRLFASLEEPGLFERARHGVLFVDEIGDLPRPVQKRLREVLAASNDVRLIAATRRDLDRDVAEGRFDDALLFALGAGRIELPALRDRHGDVSVLARHFWEAVRPTAEMPPPELPVDLLPRFEHYTWPGNVRELFSAVTQRATFGELPRTYLSDRAVETGGDIVETVIQEGLPFPTARDRVLQGFERRYVEAMLARHNGQVATAAKASGVALRYFQLVRSRSR